MKPSPNLFEENLITIFNTSSSPIYVCVGEKMIVEYANDATLKAWGRDASVIGKPFIEGLPELESQPFPALLKQVYETGIPYHSEKDRADLLVDGKLQTFYFKFTYKPLKDSNNIIWGILCTATDVTELVNAQKAVEASEDNLKRMILQAPVAMCILRGSSHIVEIANHLMIELWGANKDIVGKPVFAGLPQIQGQGFEELLQSVFKTGERLVAYEMPAMLPRAGREEKVYLNFLYEAMRDAEGNVDAIMVVATEVTEQVLSREKVEESERQFKQIADSMPQMVWVTDPTGFHEYYNQRWYDFTGSDFEETKGEGWAGMFHPDDREIAWEKWRYSLNTGEPYEIEYRLKNGRTGEYVWFLGRAVPIVTEAGEIIRWFGTCTDINEQKQQQQQKDDFIGIASHELKTPLTALKASLQLMERVVQKEPEKDPLRRLIMQSNKSLNKLGYLVDDLLNVTKIQEGQISLNKSTFNIADSLSECCHHIRMEGRYKLFVEGDLDLEVHADANRIDQVIVNLVNNAVKYAPASKEIRLLVERLPGKARISVIDEGPGIPSEKIPHLFNRYYRVDSSGNQISGLGLGLYISNDIIQRHGGKMGVESEIGKGSKFWFTLPL